MSRLTFLFRSQNFFQNHLHHFFPASILYLHFIKYGGPSITNSSTANLILTGTSLLLVLSACNNTPLLPLDSLFNSQADTSAVQVNFCTDPATNQKIVEKMLIILDHSGSNQENYLMAADGSGAPALVNGDIVISKDYATDPTGHTRYGDINTPGTLLNYLHGLPPNDPADPSLFFALVDFNAQATSFPTGNSGFTADIPGFYQHVLTDAGGLYPNNNPPNDSGDTSYLSALGAAYSIINADIQSAKSCAALAPGSPSPGANCPVPGTAVASYYTIVFMSDGSPITSIGGVGMDANGNIVVTGPITITEEPSSQILGEVGTIIALASNTKYVAGMNLFSIYYYHPGNVDQNGQQLLANMAQAGNGIAYNALSGSNINYEAFLPSSKHIKYTLSDVFVTNSSVVMETDGKAHPDSDRDGLADDQELVLGTDPMKADTYGIGITDLVLNQLKGNVPCQNMNALGICTDPLPSLAACSGLGAAPYPSSDPGGLNDCEKLALNDAGGVDNPDSNGDLIVDWLELKNGVPFQSGTSPPVTSPGLDGMSIYEKIKFSLPANTPLYELIDPQPATYTMQMLSTSDLQDCYQLNVTQLPVSGDGNTVRVDVILKSELLQDQKLYRVGTKAFAPGSQSLEFNDWNDAGEIAAGTWRSWP